MSTTTAILKQIESLGCKVSEFHINDVVEGDRTIRDLLLAKGHLIPHDLLPDAHRLVEHYDRWLEKFEKVRGEQKPADDEQFVFVGTDGFPFPRGIGDAIRGAVHTGVAAVLRRNLKSHLRLMIHPASM